MLSDVRVLELSAPSTMLAGQILADLGADVVVLEPPGGAAGRRLPPFVDDRPGLANGLTWHALNRNKRGITLDTASTDGRAILQAMLTRYDVVIEAAPRSVLDGFERPQTLIACNIRAFSRSGPKSSYHATELIVTAAGGAPALAGAGDRPPLFFPIPQADMEAGAEAAVAVLAALVARDRYDVGQDVHVQGRVAASLASFGRLVSGRSGDRPGQRSVAQRAGGAPTAPAMYACADGYVTITVVFLPAFVAMIQNIAAWLVDEGELTPDIASANFLEVAKQAAVGESDGEPIALLIEALALVCKRKSKDEVAEISRQRHFMAAPIMTMADVARFEHYHARGLFATQRIAGREVDVPARFAQFSDYQIEVRRSAPDLSEHTVDVLTTDAGLSLLEVQALFAEGVV